MLPSHHIRTPLGRGVVEDRSDLPVGDMRMMSVGSLWAFLKYCTERRDCVYMYKTFVTSELYRNECGKQSQRLITSLASPFKSP